MIKVFLDTNILFANNKKIFKKIEFGGEYVKIAKRLEKLNKFSNMIKIYIPELAILEFKNNCIEEFCKQKEKIDSFNENLKEIFGNNVLHKTTIPWKNVEEFTQYLDDEINLYIRDNVEEFSVLKTPDCFKKIITKAVLKKPLFKEAKSGTKTYYDAGLKDNLILETCLENLLEFEVGILYTRDNDFTLEQQNLHVVKSLDELEMQVEKLCPDYVIYDILYEIEGKKTDILSFLDINYDTELNITGFTKEECEYDEEEDTIKFVIIANINNEEKHLSLTYCRYLKEIINVIEKEYT